MNREQLISRIALRAARGEDQNATLYRLIVTGIPREVHGASHEGRIRMTTPRPPLGTPHWDGLIAAVVEHLSEVLGFPKPEWTAEPERYLDEPWIGGIGPKSWSEALRAAPAAFLRHGAFIDPRSLNERGGETVPWT